MSVGVINEKTETQLNSVIFEISSRLIDGESNWQKESYICDELDYINTILGFESAIVCSVGKNNGKNEIVNLINHSYPERWIESYLSEGFLAIDPVIQVANSTSCIVEWDKVSKECTRGDVSNFWDSASDEAIKRGISIKCKKTLQANETIISFSNIPVKNLNISKVILSSFAPIFDHILNKEVTSPANPLTKRELEIILWMSEGKTVWEISKILCVSEGTVKFHTKNIFAKLDVNSRTLAVVKAIRSKII